MKITNKDIIWGYLSPILQIGASLFLLPVVLKKLSADEMGIFYIFISFSSLINLLDFGLSPTFARNISYIFSGVKNLESEGISFKNSTEIDYYLLKLTINAVKKIYTYISLIIMILCNTFGLLYINNLLKQNTSINRNLVLLAWIIYVSSLAFNFYYYYYTPLLLGRNLIKESHKTIVLTRITYILIAYFLVSYNFGLLGIGIASLLSSFVNQISSHLYFYDKKIKYLLNNIKTNNSEEIKIIKIILKNSSKLGLVSVAAFLINKSSVFIMSAFLGLTIIGKYGLTLQIAMVLTSVSVVVFNTYQPTINYLRTKNETDKIMKIFSISLCIAYTTYILGSIFLVLFGNKILLAIKSNTLILENKYLIIFLFINFLEMNHSIAATLITTKNTVPFVKPALLSGIGIIILMILSLKYTKMGIYGIILSQGLIQLSYNNWKWPIEITKDLSTNYFKMLKIGINEIKKHLKRRKYEGHK